MTGTGARFLKSCGLSGGIGTLRYIDARRSGTQVPKLRKLPRATGKGGQGARGRRPAARAVTRTVRKGDGSERDLPEAARRGGNQDRDADQEGRQNPARAIRSRERMSLR